MKTVNVEFKTSDNASRLELFVRIVWSIPTLVVLYVFSIVAGICLVIQWFIILITGKRNMELNQVNSAFLAYCVKFDAYVYMVTDERSPIIPTEKPMKNVKFSARSAPQASRSELFVRILWLILTGIVMIAFSIIIFFCSIIEWLFILVIGKRNRSLNGALRMFVIYVARSRSYLYMLTDERSPIVPRS